MDENNSGKVQLIIVIHVEIIHMRENIAWGMTIQKRNCNN